MPNRSKTERILAALAEYKGHGASHWSLSKRTGGWALALVCAGCELDYLALLPEIPKYEHAFAALASVLERLGDQPEARYIYDLARLLDILVITADQVWHRPDR